MANETDEEIHDPFERVIAAEDALTACAVEVGHDRNCSTIRALRLAALEYIIAHLESQGSAISRIDVDIIRADIEEH